MKLFRNFGTHFSFFFLKKILFIYLWLRWVFVAACGLSLIAMSGEGATLHCNAQASYCSGFSCCGAWALGARASVVVARGLSSCGSWALECRLSSCGAQSQLPCSMWDLPGPGIEPLSPALAGGFLTTVPPGKPRVNIQIGALQILKEVSNPRSEYFVDRKS